jgi:hypothetical protein
MTPEQIIGLLPEAEAETLHALLAARDQVDDVMNSLVFMAVTLAIAAEVTPEAFAAGVKASWRHIADQVNAATLEGMEPEGRA